MKTNVLYYRDNLDILQRYLESESVDLVYLDPPFNSDRNYNVIFKDEPGRKSHAQLLAVQASSEMRSMAASSSRSPSETAP